MTAHCPGRSDSVTGVILAGGKSTRMGQDKATLVVKGLPLFERVRKVFRLLFAKNLIAGDRPDLARPDLPCYADIYPGSALGGLYTGLLRAETEWIFVAPCDMPFPDPALIRTITALRAGYDVVVPRTRQGFEPLFACYAKSCLEPMRQLLDHRRFRVFDFYDQVRVRYLEEDELPPGWQKALVNLNTPEDCYALDQSLPD